MRQSQTTTAMGESQTDVMLPAPGAPDEPLTSFIEMQYCNVFLPNNLHFNFSPRLLFFGSSNNSLITHKTTYIVSRQKNHLYLRHTLCT